MVPPITRTSAHPRILTPSWRLGRRFRNRLSLNSRNVRLWLVVCNVEDHVTKFAFVHELTAFWTLEKVFFFFRRQFFVFGKCHFLALNSERLVLFRVS